VSNLTVACEDCNQSKNNLTAAEFGHPNIQKQALRPLKDATAVNATRYAIGAALKTLGLPISFWSGGRTKFNRTQQGYPKAHWIDAACVGESGNQVKFDLRMQVWQVKATGHGSRQMCRMDRFGFPRTAAKAAREVKGFRTGDMVQSVVPSGKKAGTHIGKVAVRASGSFNVSTTVGVVQGISHKHCSVLHRADGYLYLLKQALLSALKNRVSAPRRFHELDIMILLAGKKKVLIQSRIMVAQSQRRHSWN
jgi:hypothetical protein